MAIKIIKYTDWIIRYKYVVLCSVLLTLAVTAFGTTKLEFVADLKVFFGEDNPQLQDLNRFEEAFAKNGSIIFTVESRNEKDVFNRQSLTAIKEITKASWEIPFSSRVNSITNYSYTWAHGDELIVEELVADPETMDPSELESVRGFALGEPLLVNSLVSEDGNLALVVVVITSSDESVSSNLEITSFSKELQKKLQAKYPEQDIRVSGSEIFDFAYGQISKNDMLLLYPIMFVVMVIMMFLLIRSVSGVFVTLLIVVASAFSAMGCAGWLGINLTSASSVAPVIILTLAVADSIHILVAMLYFIGQGKSKVEAIKESLRINIQPVFLTSVTTAIGFLSMVTCDSPPFQDLGIIVAIGVVAAFVYSVTLLPVLMIFLPVNEKKIQAKSTGQKFTLMDRVGNFVINKRKLLLCGMSCFMVVCAFGFPRLELSDNFVEYFDERYEIRQIADYVEDNIPAFSGIEYLLDSGEEGGINEPEYLHHVEQFTNWCLEQPEVTQVTSMLHTIKRLNMNMHGDDPAYYVIPERRDLVAQYMLLYEMSLPFGHDVNGTVTPDRSAMRFSVLQKRRTTLQLRQFEQRAALWLAENWQITQPPKATGMPIMFAHISERNIKSMLKSTTVALFIISGILIFAFRSWKIGLFSILPNVMPAIMTFGLWGLLAGNINMAVSYIAAMSLGVVVDDTVHFLSKYLRARRELNLEPVEAIQYSFHTVGLALLTTSLVLSAGFSVLFFSGFVVNSVMGILMALAILFALLADFFFLPPVLLLLERNSEAK